jgi:hypothetical protein
MTEPSTDAARSRALLLTLARTDPDFAAFAADEGALAGPVGAGALAGATVDALATATLAALREAPDLAARIEHLAAAPVPARFDAGAAGVPLLLAVVFLLRTHLRIRRHPDGRWDLLVEHKPGDSNLITDLLKRLAGLLPDAEG